MQTTYSSQVMKDYRNEMKATMAALAARGVRDVITVMEWDSGLLEINGNTVRGRAGGNSKFATLADYMRATFGSGKLKAIKTGSIEGRKTITYEVI